jgi:protein-disulfide isomerase
LAFLTVCLGCGAAVVDEEPTADGSTSECEPSSAGGSVSTGDVDPDATSSTTSTTSATAGVDETTTASSSTSGAESSSGVIAECGSPLVDPDDRLEVLASPMRGNPDGLVTVVIWTGFADPFSRSVQTTLGELLDGPMGSEIRVVSKQLPLPFQDPGEVFARAGAAAHLLGAYWPFHDAMFAYEGDLDMEAVDTIAVEVGIDLEALHDAMEGREVAAALEADRALFEFVGASGTPSWVANGAFFVGAQPLDVFESAASEQLGAMVDLVDAGRTPCEAYAERLDVQLP